MNTLNLAVRFELHPTEDHAAAFVNDIHVGRVSFKGIKGNRRLTFRCRDNPFKSVVRLPRFIESDDRTVAEALQDRQVQEQLIPIVIRNAIANRCVIPAAFYNFTMKSAA